MSSPETEPKEEPVNTRPYERAGFGPGALSTVSRFNASHGIAPGDVTDIMADVAERIPPSEQEAGPTC